jgi:hypothetical protein
VLSETSVTPAEAAEAVAINEAARLAALKATFLILAVISLLSIIPALRLPNYTPGELEPEDLYANWPQDAEPA